MHEIHHSSIYKLKKGYYISSFSPIEDEDGRLVGIIGMDTKISDQILLFKKIVIQMVLFIFLTYIMIFLFIRKWLNKILRPISQMMVGLNELSVGNFDVKMEVNEHSELKGLMKNFNEVVDNLASLFTD